MLDCARWVSQVRMSWNCHPPYRLGPMDSAHVAARYSVQARQKMKKGGALRRRPYRRLHYNLLVFVEYVALLVTQPAGTDESDLVPARIRPQDPGDLLHVAQARVVPIRITRT